MLTVTDRNLIKIIKRYNKVLTMNNTTDVINITIKEIMERYNKKDKPKTICYYCNKEGHIEKYCYRKQRKELKEMKCYKCGEKGHRMMNCKSEIESNINNSRKARIQRRIENKQNNNNKNNIPKDNGYQK